MYKAPLETQGIFNIRISDIPAEFIMRAWRGRKGGVGVVEVASRRVPVGCMVVASGYSARFEVDKKSGQRST